MDATLNLPAGKSSVLEAALALRNAGFSVIPIRCDGSKAPALGEWTTFQARRMSEEDVRRFFSGHVGIALVGGPVSGGLEILDFEDVPAYDDWRGAVACIDRELLRRLPVIETPGGGRHVPFRSPCPQGSEKIANVRDKTRGKAGLILETKGGDVAGEGCGYVLTLGSPAACHETGNLYRHVDGPSLTEVPTLTAAERALLINCGRCLDECGLVENIAAPEPPSAPGHGLRPGDDFNRRGEWPAILEPHGWRTRGAANAAGRQYWVRPGKVLGCSGTTGHCRNERSGDLFFCFSSSAPPLEAGKAYSRFSAFAILNHGGDFAAAAATLAKQGFGDPTARSPAARTTIEGPGGIRAEIVCGSSTAAKQSAILDLSRGDKTLPSVGVTSAASSIDKVAREVTAALYADVAPPPLLELKGFLRQALAAAQTPEAPRSGGKTAIEIVRAHAKERFALAYRNARGQCWSECERRWKWPNQFREELVDGELLRLLEGASDAPSDTRGAPLKGLRLHGPAEKLAMICWAEIVRGLPEQVDAGLGQGSGAASAFRASLIALWTKSKTFVRGSDGYARATTLIAEALLRAPAAPSGLWTPVHPGYSAWVRRSPGGIELGQRPELFRQLDMADDLPYGASDFAVFSRLVARYELGSEATAGKGGKPIVLLSAAVVAELSDSVAEDEDGKATS